MEPGQWGVLSGFLDLASFAAMIQPVAWPRRGRPRQVPPRLPWLIWACLYQVLFWSSADAGARGSLWIVGAEVVGTSSMFGLALKWGSGSLAIVRVSLRPRLAVAVPSWADLLVLLGAAVALTGWQLASSAALGVILSVITDSLAALPLVRGAWREPWTTSRLGWASTGLASVAAIFSVSRGQQAVLYAYPVAGAVLDAAIVTVLLAAWYREGGFQALFRAPARVKYTPRHRAFRSYVPQHRASRSNGSLSRLVPRRTD